jgi:hypothetical protein
MDRDRILSIAVQTLGRERFERLVQSVERTREFGRLRYWQEQLLARLAEETGGEVLDFNRFIEVFEGVAQPTREAPVRPEPPVEELLKRFGRLVRYYLAAELSVTELIGTLFVYLVEYQPRDDLARELVRLVPQSAQAAFDAAISLRLEPEYRVDGASTARPAWPCYESACAGETGVNRGWAETFQRIFG